MSKKNLFSRLFSGPANSSRQPLPDPPAEVRLTAKHGYSLTQVGFENTNRILHKRKGDMLRFHPAAPLQLSAIHKMKKILSFRMYIPDRQFNSMASCRFLELPNGNFILDEWRVRGAPLDLVELLISEMDAIHRTGVFLPMTGQVPLQDFDMKILSDLFAKYSYRVKDSTLSKAIEIFR